MSLKKILAVLPILFLLLTACDNEDSSIHMPVESLSAGNRGTPITGSFIHCEEVVPSEAVSLVNDWGMSGLRAPNHLHNTESNSSYVSKKKGADGAVTFVLPQVEALGYMHIWNYNANGDTTKGMKEVKIQYSTDGEAWYCIGNGEYTLSEALTSENEKHGGNAANNQNDANRSPIDFMGVPAKYIKIVPKSNYGGSGYGLSEVRFFRYKTRPSEGSILAVSADSPLCSSSVSSSLTNNWGMSDLYSAEATVSNDPAVMWYTESDNASDAMIVLNLDGNYPLSKLVLWNYNASSKTDSGICEFKLAYTVKSPYSASDGVINYMGGDWIGLDTYTIPEATGDDGLAPSLVIDLENIHAQHLRITPISNHGGTGFGLSALRLFTGSGWAVEPSVEWTGLFSSEGSFPYQLSTHSPRGGYGWLAADGIYSVNMNGSDMPGSADSSTKTVFLFSDTAVGNFKNFSGSFGKHGDNLGPSEVRNHSMATLTGNMPDPRNLQVYLHAGGGYGNIFGFDAWAQELIRVGDNLYSWAMRYRGWDPYQYDLVKFDIGEDGFPSFLRRAKVTDAFPIRETEGIYTYEFSAAAFDNTETGMASPSPDGYIYIYGLLSWNDGFWLQKSPIVARIEPSNFEDRSQWKFWTGTSWDSELKNSVNINASGSDVSSEYSISYINDGMFAGKYMMTYTKDTMFNELCFRVSDTPYGPFGEPSTLYYSPEVHTILEDIGVDDIYTYNGKAHPHISAKGELLMTYNVNSRSFKTAMEFLHPQFLNMFTIEKGQ